MLKNFFLYFQMRSACRSIVAVEPCSNCVSDEKLHPCTSIFSMTWYNYLLRAVCTSKGAARLSEHDPQIHTHSIRTSLSSHHRKTNPSLTHLTLPSQNALLHPLNPILLQTRSPSPHHNHHYLRRPCLYHTRGRLHRGGTRRYSGPVAEEVESGEGV